MSKQRTTQETRDLLAKAIVRTYEQLEDSPDQELSKDLASYSLALLALTMHSASNKTAINVTTRDANTV